jgi:hypothetical protein
MINYMFFATFMSLSLECFIFAIATYIYLVIVERGYISAAMCIILSIYFTMLGLGALILAVLSSYKTY